VRRRLTTAEEPSGEVQAALKEAEAEFDAAAARVAEAERALDAAMAERGEAPPQAVRRPAGAEPADLPP
jgi:hypothetical protein